MTPHLVLLALVCAATATKHPRIRLTDEQIRHIVRTAAADPIAAGMLKSVEAGGARLLSVPVLQYNKSGPGQLLDVAGAVVNRMYTLGFLHRLANGTTSRWAERAVQEMLAVSNFSDWNPAHFLDTAEISHGMAVGYDWTYSSIVAGDRKTIEAAMLKNGFGAYLHAIRPENVWARGDWNWNQVVNGGMTVAALSFGDAHDRLVAAAAAATLGNATTAIRLGFDSYAPQGAWPEGPGYWGYGTRYALTASASLQTATGNDLGLRTAAGFKDTGKFCIYHMGPAGHNNSVFNWADSHEGPCEPANLLQLAAMFPDLYPTYAPTARQLIDGGNYSTGSARPAWSLRSAGSAGSAGHAAAGEVPEQSQLSPSPSEASAVPLPPSYRYTPGEHARRTCCVWYSGSSCQACIVSLATYSAAGSIAGLSKLLPLDYLFKRRAVGFFRSSWTNPNGSWLGFKGCNSTADHGDLDAGTFVLEMGGQRWAIDLGSENYAVPGYWNKVSAHGARYGYYRKGTRGQNTLTFGGWDGDVTTSNQRVGGPDVMISQFHGNGASRQAVVDMSSAYSHQGAGQVVRSFVWDPGMTELSVTDVFSFGTDGDNQAPNVTWAMHTRAAITISGSQAILSQGGVALVATLHAPAGATFTSTAVGPLKPPQYSTAGIFKLMVETGGTAGKIVVSFELQKKEKARTTHPFIPPAIP